MFGCQGVGYEFYETGINDDGGRERAGDNYVRFEFDNFDTGF